ncbi:hypothetical protein LTR56_024227 [Elasticomyces elasticus]|nr:hypothetical protein LTR56_024227 [Elasticomyces elasticus]KAK3625354.1 hypothetical protein LTR22_023609 [Elasticomyces elasticus]KAK4905980.1 hypothetical protein LTR49_024793 [Elasticomyces elasticus]KAK5756447.1 hypothetical protein LTS12_013401 [Elasticomyces elasticus]
MDALCINQYDFAERSMQVANMLGSYKQANRVIVWLGEHGDHTKMCFRLWQIQERNKENLDALDVLGTTCSNHAAMLLHGLRDLMQRPWYNRIWIRQEIWAAQRILVACGDSMAAWHLPRAAALADALTNRWIGVRPTGLVTASDLARATVGNATLANRYRNMAGSGDTSTDLLVVIQQSSHCECSDARDRIYGVLGMTTVGSQTRLNATQLDGLLWKASLPIDYRRSVSQVFQDSAIWIMTMHQSLSILLLDATYGGMVDGNTVPSWCPNWSRPFGMGKCTENFGHPHRFIPNVITIHESLLRIKGYKTGTILSTRTETTEDGGLGAYASIRRNEEAAWLKDSLETEFMCEVNKDASPGNEVLFTEHCKCALLLRPLDGKVWQYTGWVYDFPFLSKYQRGLRQEKLIQGAAFDDFDIL